ncbi:MAG: hypothetical protein HC880_13080 [Bacteroidia bacterium]|nr:hypothetical protein [Bacteroidia bacterium]
MQKSRHLPTNLFYLPAKPFIVPPGRLLFYTLFAFFPAFYSVSAFTPSDTLTSVSSLMMPIPTDPEIYIKINGGPEQKLSPGINSFRICQGTEIEMRAETSGVGTLSYAWKDIFGINIFGTMIPFGRHW